MNIKNIIAFCVLMQNGEGILSKSPAYIEKKFLRYIDDETGKAWNWGLDGPNRQKFRRYLKIWKIK